MRTSLVIEALEQALWSRRERGRADLAGLIHRNDARIAGRTQPVVATP